MQHNSLNAYYQQAFYDVIRNAVDEFPRTLVPTIDLRFPCHYQYGDSNKEVTRFHWNHWKLSCWSIANVRTYDGNVNRFNRLRYAWVREVVNLTAVNITMYYCYWIKTSTMVPGTITRWQFIRINPAGTV